MIQETQVPVPFKKKKKKKNEFPSSPVVRTQLFHCHGPDSIPGQGAKILQAEWRSQKRKRKRKDKQNVVVVQQSKRIMFSQGERKSFHGEISF